LKPFSATALRLSLSPGVPFEEALRFLTLGVRLLLLFGLSLLIGVLNIDKGDKADGDYCNR